jgi:hypothetical protein
LLVKSKKPWVGMPKLLPDESAFICLSAKTQFPDAH